MGKKVGIMGGTFNPVHNGHLILAENAREVFSLDEILFIPSGNSYMKDTASILAGCIRAVSYTHLCILGCLHGAGGIMLVPIAAMSPCKEHETHIFTGHVGDHFTALGFFEHSSFGDF